MDYQIVDIKGKEIGKKITLDKKVFGIESNNHVVYLAIKQYMANNRQGTHKSKQRSEIIGSTRKIKKQKGTGTARAGSIKSPLFRGGGRAFGPEPRNYSFKLNKKVKKLAKKSVLSMKFSDKSVIILDKFDFKKDSVKDCLKMLSDLGIQGEKSLLVSASKDVHLLRSSKNIQKVNVINSNEVDVYSLMNANKIVFSEEAIKNVETLLK